MLVFDGLLVVGIPLDIKLLHFIRPVERAGEGLDRLAEFDTAQKCCVLFRRSDRNRDDLFVGAEDEGGAAGEASGENAHLHKPFELRRSHTSHEVDTRADDKVMTFVFRFDFDRGVVPGVG